MDEMTLLREARPDVPPVTGQALYAGRARLTAAARPVPRRRLQRIAVSGLAAVTVVVLVIGLTVAHTLSPNGAPPATAAEVLQHAAAAARSQPDPKPGQFHYVKTLSRIIMPKTGTWSPTFCLEFWTPADQPIAVRGLYGGARDCDGPPDAGMFLRNPPWLPDAETLPADPVALRTRLYSEAAKARRAWSQMAVETPDDLVFYFIRSLLASLVPSDLRAALYQTLATFPGVFLKWDATDMTGRHGVAVSKAPAPGAHPHGEVLLDRRTYRYLGERITLAGRSAESARIVDAFVDRKYQRP